MDVGWRRGGGRALRLAGRARRARPRVRHRRPLRRTLTAAGHHPVGARLLRRACCAPRRTDAPARARRRAAAPVRRREPSTAITCGFASAQLRRPRAGARANAPRPASGRPGRAARRRRTRRARSTRALHGLWFRHVVPFVGGLVSDRAAYRYLPASTAYLPPRSRVARDVRRRRASSTSSDRTLGVRRRALDHRDTRAMTDVSGVLPCGLSCARSCAIDAPVDLLDHYGAADSRGSTATTDSSRPASPRRSRPNDAVARSRDSIAHEPGADVSPAAGPAPSARSPFAGGGRLVVPARIVGRDADGRAWCTDDRTPSRRPCRSTATPRARRPAFTVDAADDQRANGARWSTHALAAIRRGELEKVVLARAVDGRRRPPLRRPRGARRLARTAARLHRLRRRRLRRREPRAAGRQARRAGHVPARWPVPASDPDDAARARPRTRANTQLVVDAVDRRRSRSAAPTVVHADGPRPRTFADVSHLATTVTARRRSRHSTSSTSSPRCTRRPQSAVPRATSRST